MMRKAKKYLILTAAVIVGLSGLIGCAKTENKQETVAVEESNTEFKSIETDDLQQKIEDPNWIVVDTRLNDAYNGWQLDGIKRGGHIKGAVDFSSNWLNSEKENKEIILDEALTTKLISKDKNIVVYDSNGIDSISVAKYLQTKGFENIYTYDLNQWASNEELPMEKYEKYQTIVPAKIVKDLIDGKKVESFDVDSKIKIVEASWGEAKNSYDKGHIPTSIHIDTDKIEPPTETEPIMWMLADDSKLAQFALDYGFTKDDTVIVTSEAQIAAYRVALVLKYMGVDDVRILNGGNGAWTAAGYELETKNNEPIAVENFGMEIPGRPEVIDTIEETIEGLKMVDKFTLVDNRTWPEYIGEISGYSYHDKKGRIPGAVFGYAGKTDAYSMDYYRNIDETMRNKDEILSLWNEFDIDTEKHLSFMCGSGWRAAEIYFYAQTLGIKDAAVYSDGWIGWSNTPELPTLTGEPTN